MVERAYIGSDCGLSCWQGKLIDYLIPTTSRRTVIGINALMASSDASDDYKHQLAIKLSRAINLVNPNDLFAERVINIAKQSSLQEFIEGMHTASGSAVLMKTDYFYRCQSIWKLQGLVSSRGTFGNFGTCEAGRDWDCSTTDSGDYCT
jgi:hypothetical protein